MKLLIATGIALIFVMGFPQEIQGTGGHFLTGNKLLQLCESNNIYEDALCAGYIAGVSDMVDNISFVQSCTPENVSMRQLQKIVVKNSYLVPEHLHRPAYQFVAVVLAATYPCK